MAVAEWSRRRAPTYAHTLNPLGVSSTGIGSEIQSAVSFLIGNDLEIAIKAGLGKLTLSVPYREWMDRAIADLGSTILQITVEYADVQTELPNHHRDPFDRMLIAQAMAERIALVANEEMFDHYGVSRLW